MVGDCGLTVVVDCEGWWMAVVMKRQLLETSRHTAFCGEWFEVDIVCYISQLLFTQYEEASMDERFQIDVSGERARMEG